MNHLRRGVWLACAALGVLVAGLPGASAQESRGSIGGRVIDAQGGVVPGATVTVVNVGTSATAARTTNAVGQYAALLLEPGTYRVTAELSGFRKTIFQDVKVGVGQRLELDFTLQPQAATEAAMVAGSNAMTRAAASAIPSASARALNQLMPSFDRAPLPGGPMFVPVDRSAIAPATL